jgi:hypothetical protein
LDRFRWLLFTNNLRQCKSDRTDKTTMQVKSWVLTFIDLTFVIENSLDAPLEGPLMNSDIMFSFEKPNRFL